MICLLWIIFKTFLVQAAASSASAEGAGGLNGGVATNVARNLGPLPGLILPQLVLIQAGPAPNGQAALALAQGPGLPAALSVLQQQAGMAPPQGPAPQPAAIVPLFALLPQANGMGNAQTPILYNGQPIQLVPVAGLNPQQGGNAAGKARIKVAQGPLIPASVAAKR
ncbi:uncharacterized protein LOC143490964 [Brachyhypopomus gauderio]|uniref:uncharacterized protein LOC143490964 n=1 Tax=Brachyhypopomus gauderio TaxID=698409 RepID=UPI00404165B7